MNYPYTSIQLIDGDVKAVVNKEVEPKIISPSKITPLIFYFIYNLWQQKHEVFEFDVFECEKVINEILMSDSVTHIDAKLLNGIEVTCIEIKDGKAWFKEENTNEDEQHKLWCEVVEIFVDTMLGDKMYPLLLEQYKITRK